MIIIDAKDQIAGRIAVVAAKQALLGEDVAIINSESAVVSGRREMVFAKYKRLRDMGVPRKGPFLPRMPDRLLRRMIRGMLPMPNARGRIAYAKILCHIGVPSEFHGKPTLVVPGANASKLPTLHKVTVGEICKHMGAEWNN